MIADELTYRIHQSLAMEPTADQAEAISVFGRFMTDRGDRVAMIMRGSAGTGKTTLAGAIVRALDALGVRMVLLAPTGRAAKVFSLNAGHQAFTIHRRIYRQKTAGDMSAFNINVNMLSDTLFIVDEASMVANGGGMESVFGSGRLLDDLIEFVYSGRNCRMMLIGDRAQLPPVGEEESPALQAEVLRCYGLDVHEADLSNVLRQAEESGILWNATMIRRMITHDELTQLPRLRLRGFADIAIVPGDELIETLATSYSRAGMDETMVITRSNKRANIYNRGIRATVLDREEELCTGDMLMVVKNKYFDSLNEDRRVKSEEVAAAVPSSLKFIANGDRARVYRVRNIHEMHGFRFAEVTLQFPDYDNLEMTQTVILDTLTTDAPALTREQNEQLFNAVEADYADIPRKADRMRSMKQDKYYSALQVKFAYAVTCHKAQGGQWAHIYVDQGYMTDDMLTPDYIHWLYTAFTRATERLYLVNWPKEQIDMNEPLSITQ
ncbi:MAG: AAA family ATPase [Prevotella sp.]|nr:AAA family ATPase [Prevotella sp.]